MDIFNTCSSINDLLNENKDQLARNELIKLLDFHKQNELEYTPLINHLIRETGLFPYLQPDTADWQDRFVFEAFKVNVGDNTPKTLHREQSSLLKNLLEGKNIVVSAPTSFGKSFVIDAFISLKNPNNVVIIVPTIALTDETRRRLYKKFSKHYKIITTPEVNLGDRNILIFPQERAINYINKICSIDILIIDEFYKAGISFDKDRAPILLKAILELGKKAKQKYFLAPNISNMENSIFTEDMEFMKLNFNTVFSKISNNYASLNSTKENFKEETLLEILSNNKGKTLIYAGTFTNIDTISNILLAKFPDINNETLNNFSDWLRVNYHKEYILADLIEKGIGIHNGKLHRSLSQIQIKLFEEELGIDYLISTSSIIEGVNTSAENVIIWANKNGTPRLDDFTYKNIIGRGGRMFRHFIGNIFLLEEPPSNESTQLNLMFTDDLLMSLDKDTYKEELSSEQIKKIDKYDREMEGILGKHVYDTLKNGNNFQSFNSNNIKLIAQEMRSSAYNWSSLQTLNSANPNLWDNALYQVLRYLGGNIGASYRDMVAFIKAISKNWVKTIPDILSNLRSNGITIEKFFELERIATFRVASILNDINTLQKHISPTSADLSPFIFKIAHAFLPKIVYELEEYGLPRIISRKIQDSEMINFEDPDLAIHDVILNLKEIGISNIQRRVSNLHPFENYMLEYFFDGISNSDDQLIELQS